MKNDSQKTKNVALVLLMSSIVSAFPLLAVKIIGLNFGPQPILVFCFTWMMSFITVGCEIVFRHIREQTSFGSPVVKKQTLFDDFSQLLNGIALLSVTVISVKAHYGIALSIIVLASLVSILRIRLKKRQR